MAVLLLISITRPTITLRGGYSLLPISSFTSFFSW